MTGFATVNDWIKAGSVRSTGYYLLRKITKVTDKAVGVPGQKIDHWGNKTSNLIFFPKSQLIAVKNDVSPTNASEILYLVPTWLKHRKEEEGYTII